MEDQIQFIAKFKDWTSIKKMKVEEKTEPKQIMEFIATLTTSFDNKIAENLGKEVKIEELDKILDELLDGVKGKSESSVAKALSSVNSLKVSKVINSICELDRWQKGEKKEMASFCKVYATKKALLKIGLPIDYSGVEIPGMKRLLKKKKK